VNAVEHALALVEPAGQIPELREAALDARLAERERVAVDRLELGARGDLFVLDW